jgi:hypothetical protein
MARIDMGTAPLMATVTELTRKGTTRASGTVTTTAATTQTKASTELLGEMGVFSRPSSLALRKFLKPSFLFQNNSEKAMETAGPNHRSTGAPATGGAGGISRQFTELNGLRSDPADAGTGAPSRFLSDLIL